MSQDDHPLWDKLRVNKMTLDEKCFRKMEWKHYKADEAMHSEGGVYNLNPCWRNQHGQNNMSELPPISSSWEVCAKYLVPFMRERGFRYAIFACHENRGPDLPEWYNCFRWVPEMSLSGQKHYDMEIKDDNIALAACQSFTEVEF